MTIKMHFDGACDNNSDAAIMGIGVAVWANQQRKESWDVAECHGKGTSNVAEYLALIAALKKAIEIVKVHPEMRLFLFGDSQLVIYQFLGKWNCNKEHLQGYLKEARLLRKQLEKNIAHVAWVPRTKNTDADVLSKLGLTKHYLKK